MADDQEKVEVAPPGAIKVEYYATDDVPSIYSDGSFVVHTENEFVISFYQTQFPPINEESAKELKELRSKCIVRIIVSPNQMRRLTEALATNLGKYDVKATVTQE